MYLLDTNIVSFLNSNLPKNEQKKIKIKNNLASRSSKTTYFVSTITVLEIYFGINKAKLKNGIEFKAIEFKQIQDFLTGDIVTILSFDTESAKIAAEIKAKLLNIGKIIPDPDIMIASIAIKNDLTLITNNTKDFEQIASMTNLKFADWTK